MEPKISPKKILKVGLFLVVLSALVLSLAVFVFPILQWMSLRVLGKPAGCRMRVWVRVVDQFGEAAKGYDLHVWGWQSQLVGLGQPHERHSWLVPDEDGVAFYDSEKRVTRVFFGSFIAENGKNLNYLPSKQSVTLSCAELSSPKGAPEKPEWGGNGQDRAHPLVVTVYKHGPPQRLLRVEHRANDLDSGARYVAVDVLKGTLWLANQPEGDFSLREVSPSDYAGMVSPGKPPPFPGIEIVAADDAGVQPVDDQYMVEPPESGYRQRLLYERDWEKVKSRPGGIQFYFYCKNRAAYGYVNMIRIRSFIYIVNVEGHRNLYYEGYPSTDPYVMKNYLVPPVELYSGEVGSGR